MEFALRHRGERALRDRCPRRRTRRADFLECLENRLLMARLTGIDVSHFQGTMNWTTARNQGLSFAFIRASRSDTLPDTQLANNMHPTSGAKAKGLIVGVYHRALPFGNVNDTRQDPGEPTDANYIEPEVDAQRFFNHGGPYMTAGYIRPVIDVEDGAILNTAPHVNADNTTTNLSQWVVRWVTKLKQLNGNINPIIYTGHYRSNLNSSVITALPDLWIANWNQTTYGDPVNGTGNPPVSPWPTWKFWQYDSPNGLGSQYGAQSVDIDLDVFNGSNINDLKRLFVIGAPTALPSGPSPANTATNVSPLNVTLNWNDTAGATRYDVYLNNMTTPAVTNLNVSQWSAGNLTGGQMHSWRVVAKAASNDDDTHVSGPTWTFTTSSLPVPGTPSNPTPNGVIVTSKPVVLNWDDTPNAATYDIYFGNNANPIYVNLTQSQSPAINPL